MYLFIKSELDLDNLAVALQGILNLPGHNRRQECYEQRRHSEHQGGLYYLWELIGVEMCLISSSGEVLEPEHPDYPFYLTITPDISTRDARPTWIPGRLPGDCEIVRGLVVHLAKFLTAEGLEVHPEPDLS